MRQTCHTLCSNNRTYLHETWLWEIAALLRGGEGTVDWDTAASNRLTGSCLSNFVKRISSKNSNWEIRARKARIEKSELDEGFQPYHPPFRVTRAAPGARTVSARSEPASGLLGCLPWVWWRVLAHVIRPSYQHSLTRRSSVTKNKPFALVREVSEGLALRTLRPISVLRFWMSEGLTQA